MGVDASEAWHQRVDSLVRNVATHYFGGLCSYRRAA